MSEISTCVMPGCLGRRDPRSALCGGHYREIPVEDRKAWSEAMFTVASAAVAGDNDALNDAVDACWEFLNRLFGGLRHRPLAALNPSETPAAEPSGQIDRSEA